MQGFDNAIVITVCMLLEAFVMKALHFGLLIFDKCDVSGQGFCNVFVISPAVTCQRGRGNQCRNRGNN